jgi:hypothetical protein
MAGPNLSEFLEDNNGGLSSTRLALLIWVFGILIVWSYSCFSANPVKLAAIDPTVLTLLGILMGGKVVQKFGEKTDSEQQLIQTAQPVVQTAQPVVQTAQPVVQTAQPVTPVP